MDTTPTSSQRGELREQIRHEAKVVGLRDVRLPSLEAVERRRMQLWVLTTVLLLAVSAAVTIFAFGGEYLEWIDRRITTASILVLAVAFGIYAVEKELHLRKLTKLLVEERALTAALSNRLRELSALLEAGKAMNSVLELGDVLDIILGSTLELLSGQDGSIMLLEPEGELVVVCAQGNDSAKGARVRMGEGISGRVAMSREPVLLVGDLDPELYPDVPGRNVQSAICLPLINRGKLHGVLNISSQSEHPFTEYDLRALGLFAEHAASAIANARLYETTREHVFELVELDRMKKEFIASVSHDLRTPLTSILGSSIAARRSDVPEDRRAELLGVIERQARHLDAMVEQLLSAAALEKAELPELTGRVDLSALVRTVALDAAAVDRHIEVDAPAHCDVSGDAEALCRVLENLIDNAYKHGAPPVRVVVESRGDDHVMLSVVDGGSGVPVTEREKVFERFSRLDSSRSRPGLGLGLSSVRALTIACKGTVWVEDAPGGGAAFRVLLQAAEPAEIEITPGAPRQPAG